MAVSLYSTLSRRNTLIFSCHASAVGFVTDCEHVRTKKVMLCQCVGWKWELLAHTFCPISSSGIVCSLTAVSFVLTDPAVVILTFWAPNLLLKKICNLIHCLFGEAFWTLFLLSSLFFYFSRPRDFRTPFFFFPPVSFPSLCNIEESRRIVNKYISYLENALKSPT